MQFNERISKLYPELFGEQRDTTSVAGGFSRKWGSVEELYTLAQGDIRRFDEITKLRLHLCLMYLAFVKEKNETENRVIQSQMKKYK